MGEVNFEQMRRHMVQEICAHAAMVKAHIGKAALGDRVIDAMVSVPRHMFVPVELRAFAYANTPLPIGHGKTISQPFIVALMTDLLAVNAGERVLEIGTGLGYQSAILAELAERVYSVEIIDELTEEANKRLAGQGYTNVETRRSDGYHGWPAHAPFDKIMVTAAPDLIPPPLLTQLKPGGRMVIPAGTPDAQQLLLVQKDAAGRTSTQEILPVRFSVLECDEQPHSVN